MLISFAFRGRRGEVRHCLTKRQLENCRETHKWEFNELVMSPLVIGEEKFLDNCCYNHVGGGKLFINGDPTPLPNIDDLQYIYDQFEK